MILLVINQANGCTFPALSFRAQYNSLHNSERYLQMNKAS